MARNPVQNAEMYDGYTRAILTMALQDLHTSRVLVWHQRWAGPGAPSGHGLISDLRAYYGAQLVVISFAFYQGSAYLYPIAWPQTDRRVSPSIQTVPSALTNSYEAYLHTAGLSWLALDLRQAKPAGADAWLSAPHYLRQLPLGYDVCFPEDAFVREQLPVETDVVLFADRVTPPTLLGRPPASPHSDCLSMPGNLDFGQSLAGWLYTQNRPACVTGTDPVQHTAYISCQAGGSAPSGAGRLDA